MKGFLGVGLVLLALTGRAAAQPADGRAAFVAGDYATAIARFEEAYALDRDPAHLYNIAQAYRLRGDCGEAAAYFRAYVRATVAGARDRARAEAAASQMEACADAAARPRRHAGRSRSWRRIGLALGGAGAVALGAAAVVGWQSHRDAVDLAAAFAGGRATVWTPALDELEEDGQRAEALAIGLAVGGAAALLGGGALVVIGRDSAGIGWRF